MESERRDGEGAHGKALLGLEEAEQILTVVIGEWHGGYRDVCGLEVEVFAVDALGRDGEDLCCHGEDG